MKMTMILLMACFGFGLNAEITNFPPRLIFSFTNSGVFITNTYGPRFYNGELSIRPDFTNRIVVGTNEFRIKRTLITNVTEVVTFERVENTKQTFPASGPQGQAVDRP